MRFITVDLYLLLLCLVDVYLCSYADLSPTYINVMLQPLTDPKTHLYCKVTICLGFFGHLFFLAMVSQSFLCACVSYCITKCVSALFPRVLLCASYPRTHALSPRDGLTPPYSICLCMVLLAFPSPVYVVDPVHLGTRCFWVIRIESR